MVYIPKCRINVEVWSARKGVDTKKLENNHLNNFVRKLKKKFWGGFDLLEFL